MQEFLAEDDTIGTDHGVKPGIPSRTTYMMVVRERGMDKCSPRSLFFFEGRYHLCSQQEPVLRRQRVLPVSTLDCRQCPDGGGGAKSQLMGIDVSLKRVGGPRP